MHSVLLGVRSVGISVVFFNHSILDFPWTGLKCCQLYNTDLQGSRLNLHPRVQQFELLYCFLYHQSIIALSCYGIYGMVSRLVYTRYPLFSRAQHSHVTLEWPYLWTNLVIYWIDLQNFKLMYCNRLLMSYRLFGSMLCCTCYAKGSKHFWQSSPVPVYNSNCCLPERFEHFSQLGLVYS